MIKDLANKEREKSEHETRALCFAQELVDKYEVFDEFVTHRILDDFGIDILFIKRVGKKDRHFRLHIQHKPYSNEAKAFRKLNPCIPVWEVNKQTKPQEAFTSLLKTTIEKALEQRSPHAQFFKTKLKDIESLFGYNPKAQS